MEQIKQFILGLNPNHVSLAIFIVLLIAVVLFGATFYQLLTDEAIQKKYSEAKKVGYNNLTDSMRNTGNKVFNYDEIARYLKSSGALYMASGKLTPVSYLMMRAGAAIFGMVLGLQAGVILGVIGLALGFFAPDFIIKMSNESDNEKMVDDIKSIYDLIRIQTKSGVFISDSLQDCYKVVSNSRLKAAFKDLNKQIMQKNDLSESLEDFRLHFQNEYIDTLVVIIQQSLRTGKSAKMFDDIKKQIEDLDDASALLIEARINRKILAVQMLIYGSIIFATLFLVAMELMKAL